MENVGTMFPVFIGMGGATLALVLSNIGAAYGTARAGVGLAAMGFMKPEAVMKNILPVIMAGVLGIYGLIVAILIIGQVPKPGDEAYTFQRAFKHLAAGLCIGGSSIAAGGTIGIVGDIGSRSVGQQPKVYVGLILIMIFAEAVALYGLIVGLVLAT